MQRSIEETIGKGIIDLAFAGIWQAMTKMIPEQYRDPYTFRPLKFILCKLTHISWLGDKQ